MRIQRRGRRRQTGAEWTRRQADRWEQRHEGRKVGTEKDRKGDREMAGEHMGPKRAP